MQEFLHRVQDARALAAQQDHAAAESFGRQGQQELDAVDARHVQVAQDHVDAVPRLRQQEQGGLGAGGGAQPAVAHLPQHARLQAERERIVVEEQHAGPKLLLGSIRAHAVAPGLVSRKRDTAASSRSNVPCSVP